MSRLEEAKEVLNSNWTGSFTKPAPNLYPHQWNWDAGFIALGNAHIDIQRVITEYSNLFKGQWSNGFLPHIVFGPRTGKYFPESDFWQCGSNALAPENVDTSGITQPPVHGFVLWEIYQRFKHDQAFTAFLKALFPKLLALHKYYYEFRNPLQNGLIVIRHPWEPGTDNSPVWDEALGRIDLSQIALPEYERRDLQNPRSAAHRPTNDDYDRYVYLVDLFRKANYDEHIIGESCPFQIIDPLFNSILAWSNECLIDLGENLGLPVDDLYSAHELTLHSMNELLWDEEAGIYHAYDVLTKKKIETHTHSGFMPLIAGAPDIDQVLTMVKRMFGDDFRQFQHYSIPSYSLNQEDIQFEKYWRGPIWVSTNWLLIQGLKRYEMLDLADLLIEDTIALLDTYGFYEYFDPRKAVEQNGYGTNQFSWSAALYLQMKNT